MHKIDIGQRLATLMSMRMERWIPIEYFYRYFFVALMSGFVYNVHVTEKR